MDPQLREEAVREIEFLFQSHWKHFAYRKDGHPLQLILVSLPRITPKRWEASHRIGSRGTLLMAGEDHRSSSLGVMPNCLEPCSLHRCHGEHRLTRAAGSVSRC